MPASELQSILSQIDANDLKTIEDIRATPHEINSYYSWADSTNPKRFARDLEKAMPFFVDMIHGRWTDQVVLDLGSGITTSGYALAASAGARSYVGVDHYHSPCLLEKIEALPPTLPFSLALEDMLKFLHRVPDKSVSLLAAGIDRCMIPEKWEVKSAPHRVNGNYLDELSYQVKRVLHPQGMMLTWFTWLKPEGLYVESHLDDQLEIIELQKQPAV